MSNNLDTPEQRKAYLDRCERDRIRIKELEAQQRESKTRHKNKFFDEDRSKTRAFESALERMRREAAKRAILVALSFFMAVPCFAGGARLGFDWVSPLVSVSGFTFNIGSSSGVTETKIVVPIEDVEIFNPSGSVFDGNPLDGVDYQIRWVSNEFPVGTYFCSITSFSAGFESEPSDEISWTVRAISLTRGDALDNQVVAKTVYIAEINDEQNRMFYSLKFGE